MRMAGAEEGKQCQASNSCVGLGARAIAIVSEDPQFSTTSKTAGVPTTIGTLMFREPLQSGFDGRFGLSRCAAPFCQFGAIGGGPQSEDLWRFVLAITVSTQLNWRGICGERLIQGTLFGCSG